MIKQELIDLEHIVTDRSLRPGQLNKNKNNLELERTHSKAVSLVLALENYFAKDKQKPMPLEIKKIVSSLEMYLQQNPNDPFVHMGLGLYYTKNIRFQRSLAHYLLANQNSSPNWALKSPLHTKIGNAYFGLNNYELGVRHHQIAIKIDSANVSSYLCLANHYKIIGDFREAIGYAKKAEKVALPSRQEDVREMKEQIIFKMNSVN